MFSKYLKVNFSKKNLLSNIRLVWTMTMDKILTFMQEIGCSNSTKYMVIIRMSKESMCIRCYKIFSMGVDLQSNF